MKRDFITKVLTFVLSLLFILHFSIADSKAQSSYKQTVFTDNFESGLSNWLVEPSNGCQITTETGNPSPQGGGKLKVGRSTSSATPCRVTKTLTTPVVSGRVSVWFYDNASDKTKANGIVIAVKDNSNHRVWLGVSTLFDTNHYSYLYTENSVDKQVSSKVWRRTGWHKLEFYIADGKTHGVIDGTILKNIGFSDSLTEITQIVIAGGIQPTESGGYFDGFKVETLTNNNRPNIVVIMTDDQNEMSMEYMPKTKNLLGRLGMTFKNSFASNTLCCPSRATFLSGQYSHNHKVSAITPPNGGFLSFNNFNTLPMWLADAGYETVALGKYMNGYGTGSFGGAPNDDHNLYKDDDVPADQEIPPGWTSWYAYTNFFSRSRYVWGMNENGHVVQYTREPSETDEESFHTYALTNKSVEWIRNYASNLSMPFFMYINHYGVHNNECMGKTYPCSTPATAHEHLFDNLSKLTTLPNFNERDMSDKPAYMRSNPRLHFMDNTGVLNMLGEYRDYMESVVSIDEGVEKIVNELASIGKLQNTVIIFTSDNGYMHGLHGIPFSSKVYPYEESIRVPLIIYYPGKTNTVTDSVNEELVVNVDLAPTIVDIAQATPGLVMDGKSLLPLLEKRGVPWRKYVLLEAFGHETSVDKKPYTGLRTKDYKYVEYLPTETDPTASFLPQINSYLPVIQNGVVVQQGLKGTHMNPAVWGDKVDFEFYNLIKDPYELDSQHKILLSDSSVISAGGVIDQKLHQLQNCAGDNCFPTDGPPPSPPWCQSFADVWINSCDSVDKRNQNDPTCNTSTRDVVVHNKVTGAAQVRYANIDRSDFCNTIVSNDPAWSSWENYTSSKTWTLSENYGRRKVCVQFKNSGGSAKCGGTIQYLSVDTADGNGDSKIDGIDYMIWLSHFSQDLSGPPNGDFNNSGMVDGTDYTIWLSNFSS